MLATTLEVGDEKTAALHVASYETFHRWVEGGALESVRCELSATLFPVFAQCFLVVVATEAEASGEDGGEPASRAFLERWGASHADRFAAEVEALRLVTSPVVAAKDAYCARLRGGRWVVPLSGAAQALLGDFLTSTGNAAVLKVFNEKVTLDGTAPGRGEAAALVATDGDEVEAAAAALLARRRRGSALLGSEALTARARPRAGAGLGRRLRAGPAARRVAAPPRAAAARGPRGQRARAARRAQADGARRAAGADAARLSCCAASRDATRLAGGFADASLRLWRVDELAGDDAAAADADAATTALRARPARLRAGLELRAATCSPAAATGAACSGTPTRPARAGAPGAALLYAAHVAPCWSVAWCAASGGHVFATGGGDRTARLFATDRADPLRVFAGHWADVSAVCFHANAHYVLSASHDKTCRLWDVRAAGGPGRRCARVLDGAAGALAACDACPSGRKAAAAGLDGGLHLWDLDSGRKLSSTKAHRGPAYVAKFSADGAAVATSGRDRSLKVWDAAALAAAAGDDVAPAHAVETTDSPVFDVAWTPGNLCLASGPLLA
ncbi:hypothetical protein JL722_12220 [Aureococcus anophagefferens]|nr:hypothetical protein JL722_12220 [Aureococcus anophagefferens]